MTSRQRRSENWCDWVHCHGTNGIVLMACCILKFGECCQHPFLNNMQLYIIYLHKVVQQLQYVMTISTKPRVYSQRRNAQQTLAISLPLTVQLKFLIFHKIVDVRAKKSVKQNLYRRSRDRISEYAAKQIWRDGIAKSKQNASSVLAVCMGTTTIT